MQSRMERYYQSEDNVDSKSTRRTLINKDLYEKIYDLDNLRMAHKNARKGKGWYKEVKMVDSDEEHYLKMLQEMLKYFSDYMLL